MNLHRLITLFSIFGFVCSFQLSRAQKMEARDLYSDTWVGSDELGRALPTLLQTHSPRTRYVGIFYFLTHGMLVQYHNGSVHNDNPLYLHDNTTIIKLVGGDPLTKPRVWDVGGTYWWGEPAVGYFLADDPWVIHHNLTMLSDAGVDVLFFDVTNAFTYESTYLAICKVAEKMRREGLKTPQIAFVTHAAVGRTVTKLYDDFYSKGLYRDLWFLWDGKPIVLGDESVPMAENVRNFFTWRYSWAWDPGKDKWQWIDNYPQRYGWHTEPSIPEEIPVSIAGHPTSDLGRSFQGAPGNGGREPPLNSQDVAADVNRGDYFQEQWNQALKVDPPFVFVTGWNEWTAGCQTDPPGEHIPFLGVPTQPGNHFFVDEYNEEFSRDAMPMKGGFGDNYYMQLAANIRRYKGVRPIPVSYGFHTMRLTDLHAWEKITPKFRAAEDAVEHRNWMAWGNKPAINNSGRNDIVAARVACDSKNIYFYVRAQSPLTRYTDSNWMQLLIDSDQNHSTGWEGYDYVVNNKVINHHITTLKKLADGKIWKLHYRIFGNEMMIIVPRYLLGLNNLNKTAFDFHWVDNCPIGGDIVHFWYTGDSAPDGRFNYRYIDVRRKAR